MPLSFPKTTTGGFLFSVSIRRHKSRVSHVNVFTPLWRTIKNSGRAAGSASGQEDRLEKIVIN